MDFDFSIIFNTFDTEVDIMLDPTFMKLVV